MITGCEFLFFTLLQESTYLCLLTIETIFVEVLKRGDMYLENTITLTISGKSNLHYLKVPSIFFMQFLKMCKKILFY